MRTRRSIRLAGLVAFLLAVILLVPAEASTPYLPEQQFEAGCSAVDTAFSARWGTCNDINCCGGPPEAECMAGGI